MRGDETIRWLVEMIAPHEGLGEQRQRLLGHARAA